MKNTLLTLMCALALIACKDNTTTPTSEVKEDIKEVIDSTPIIKEKAPEVIIEAPKTKTAKQIKKELTVKGFKVFYDIDIKTKDTFLMQQYFMAFLKKGPIRGQNEEEVAELQKQHLAHLTKMYELGYADISGPFEDDGNISGITVYNVPTLKMADSLANLDPMVKAGRLKIEMHSWWAAKGFSLR